MKTLSVKELLSNQLRTNVLSSNRLSMVLLHPVWSKKYLFKCVYLLMSNQVASVKLSRLSQSTTSSRSLSQQLSLNSISLMKKIRTILSRPDVQSKTQEFVSVFYARWNKIDKRSHLLKMKRLSLWLKSQTRKKMNHQLTKANNCEMNRFVFRDLRL